MEKLCSLYNLQDIMVELGHLTFTQSRVEKLWDDIYDHGEQKFDVITRHPIDNNIIAHTKLQVRTAVAPAVGSGDVIKFRIRFYRIV